jgi:hypothetical protein
VDSLADSPFGVFAGGMYNSGIVGTWNEGLPTVEVHVQLLHVVGSQLGPTMVNTVMPPTQCGRHSQLLVDGVQRHRFELDDDLIVPCLRDGVGHWLQSTR